jgi:hypothetical protein
MTFVRAAMSSISTDGGSRQRQAIPPIVCPTGQILPTVTASTTITGCRLTAFEPSRYPKADGLPLRVAKIGYWHGGAPEQFDDNGCLPIGPRGKASGF